MAITLLRITTDQGPTNCIFKTEEIYMPVEGLETHEEKLIGKVQLVDNDLKPISDIIMTEVLMEEEEYHKSLRKQAAGVGQLITSHCTDPEWNPEGYIKNLEDVLHDEKSRNG